MFPYFYQGAGTLFKRDATKLLSLWKLKRKLFFKHFQFKACPCSKYFLVKMNNGNDDSPNTKIILSLIEPQAFFIFYFFSLPQGLYVYKNQPKNLSFLTEISINYRHRWTRPTFAHSDLIFLEHSGIIKVRHLRRFCFVSGRHFSLKIIFSSLKKLLFIIETEKITTSVPNCR